MAPALAAVKRATSEPTRRFVGAAVATTLVVGGGALSCYAECRPGWGGSRVR